MADSCARRGRDGGITPFVLDLSHSDGAGYPHRFDAAFRSRERLLRSGRLAKCDVCCGEIG